MGIPECSRDITTGVWLGEAIDFPQGTCCKHCLNKLCTKCQSDSCFDNPSDRWKPTVPGCESEASDVVVVGENEVTKGTET